MPKRISKHSDTVLVKTEDLDKRLEEAYFRGYSDAMREFQKVQSASPKEQIGSKSIRYNIIKRKEQEEV